MTTGIPSARLSSLYIQSAVFYGAISLFYLACMWKVYKKAGKPGWASIIPIYNIIVMLEIIGKPAWWFFLMLIPGVNIVIGILLAIEFGKVFGKDTTWSIIFLILFSFIGYPILAFGDATYTPPSSTPTPPPANAPTGVSEPSTPTPQSPPSINSSTPTSPTPTSSTPPPPSGPTGAQ